jgi:hypothetical protein
MTKSAMRTHAERHLAKPIQQRLREANLCEPECYGRCIECPQDLAGEAADAIDAAALAGWQTMDTAPKEGDFLVWHHERIRQVCLYNGPDIIPVNTVIDAIAGRMWVATCWHPMLTPPRLVMDDERTEAKS